MSSKKKRYELYYTLNTSKFVLPGDAKDILTEKLSHLTHEQKEALILLIYEHCQLGDCDIAVCLCQKGKDVKLKYDDFELSLKKILHKFITVVCK
ncbi:MAG TPA: hypothetical protein VLE02_00860 [Nitrosarchaeum sp.]|nr:hypothetical protein [Nitrosarchaeum sp.]